SNHGQACATNVICAERADYRASQLPSEAQ
ncbi:MAG: hypothetical protein ACI8UD_001570, partial [Planctomycetota bacterium]